MDTYSNKPADDSNPPITFDALMKAMEPLRDRMPAIVSRVRMSSLTWQSIQEYQPFRKVAHADFAPGQGIDLFLDESLPLGRIDEWDGEKWVKNPIPGPDWFREPPSWFERGIR